MCGGGKSSYSNDKVSTINKITIIKVANDKKYDDIINNKSRDIIITLEARKKHGK